jgi:hypothetical protein
MLGLAYATSAAMNLGRESATRISLRRKGDTRMTMLGRESDTRMMALRKERREFTRRVTLMIATEEVTIVLN